MTSNQIELLSAIKTSPGITSTVIVGDLTARWKTLRCLQTRGYIRRITGAGPIVGYGLRLTAKGLAALRTKETL